MLERQHQKEIEQAVIELLEDYDLAKYPISVGMAAEALGVKVVPYSFKEEEADYFAGYLLAPHPLILTLPKDAAVTERFGVSGQCASFAIDQANSRRKESSYWEPHEQWLVNNAIWRGGGLIGRA